MYVYLCVYINEFGRLTGYPLLIVDLVLYWDIVMD